jgi:fatty-acyl-CoA synthase
MPRETSDVIDREGWFRTGDLGIRDNAGYLKITGRNRNVIIRGGENIYPKEVESLLLTHPDIGDVRVVGVPSRRLGEELFAFVTAAHGRACNTQNVREYFRNKMSRHMTPRWVKTVGVLPRAQDGKVDRNELRRWAIGELELRDGDCYQVLYDN